MKILAVVQSAHCEPLTIAGFLIDLMERLAWQACQEKFEDLMKQVGSCTWVFLTLTYPVAASWVLFRFLAAFRSTRRAATTSDIGNGEEWERRNPKKTRPATKKPGEGRVQAFLSNKSSCCFVGASSEIVAASISTVGVSLFISREHTVEVA